MGFNIPTVVGLLDEDNCLAPVSRSGNVDLQDTTASLSVLTPIWRPGQLAGQASSTVNSKILDIIVESNAQSYSWCSKTTHAFTAVEAGSVDPLCTDWDGVYKSVPFIPNKVTAPYECTDVALTWIYRVVQKGFNNDNDYFKMSVDSKAGLIWVKAMPGGPTPYKVFTVRIVGMLDDYLETRTSFYFEIQVGCTLVPPPTVLDQTYIVADPMGFYDAPVFTIGGNSTCSQTINYSNTVTTNNFIDDNGSAGKYLSW